MARLVYYDQWEDGSYDADIANPGSNVYNASTQPRWHADLGRWRAWQRVPTQHQQHAQSLFGAR